MRSIFLALFLVACFLQPNMYANEGLIQQEQMSDDFASDFESEFTPAAEVFDPLRGYNEVMTEFNDGFYVNILTPVSRTYKDVVHENVRLGVSNVFDNLMFPVRFINNILQFKFLNASEELGRFVVNSTFGLLGIMDVAKDLNLEAHKEDFGQTLGFYGVGSGFHVVIPFLGPSNLRDIVGLSVDSFADPTSTNVAYEPYQIPDNSLEMVGIKGFDAVNTTSFHINEYETMKADAIELYPFLRDIYEQRRNKLIEE